MAVLVTLVTSGFSAALIVLIVAVAVQQFDNDLLAPIVFGRSLSLHPLIVLGAIVAGSTLFGVFGAVLAVPVCAVVINVMAETWAAARGRGGGADADDLTPALEPGCSSSLRRLPLLLLLQSGEHRQHDLLHVLVEELPGRNSTAAPRNDSGDTTRNATRRFSP